MSIFDKSIKFGKSIFTGSIFVVLCLAHIAYSQVTTGQIAGVVTDPNGAVVPGASVKATNTETNSVRETTTNGTGVYSFQLLPPGRYRVSATASGFSETGVEAVVNITQTTNVDVTLCNWRNR